MRAALAVRARPGRLWRLRRKQIRGLGGWTYSLDDAERAWGSLSLIGLQTRGPRRLVPVAVCNLLTLYLSAHTSDPMYGVPLGWVFRIKWETWGSW